MLPKEFFENHFSGELDDNLFVAMASDGTDMEKIATIKRVLPLGKAVVYIKEDILTNEITYKIFNAIAKSKVLLFDLSNDARLCARPFKRVDRINSNVMYELGVALTIRNPNSIILIRKKSDGPLEKVPFDIRGIGMQTYQSPNAGFLNEIFIKQKEKTGYFNEQLLSGVADLIDEIGYAIMHWALEQPVGKRHFPLLLIADYIRKEFSYFETKDEKGDKIKFIYEASNEEVRMSVFRLLNLGIVVKKSDYTSEGKFQHAYHWTEFGKEILEYVNKIITDKKK